ncbi:MAG: hypothetical protein OXI15_23860 [Chromatiales bacterium]|nr:hypothetical protein [Chromatiales bacterium]
MSFRSDRRSVDTLRLVRHYPTHLPSSVDASLRTEFRILIEPPVGR